MNCRSQTIFIISSDSLAARNCIEELKAIGGSCATPVVNSIEQARREFKSTPPVAIYLDESVIDPLADGDSLASAAAWLAETAPVVVTAAAEKQSELVFLLSIGAVDFVARTGNYWRIVAGMLDRRARLGGRGSGTMQFPPSELSGDFGEVLRHEVNNPLTGILGNTELLLARRDRLPPAAQERLRTIAELAVRLRETVRRLSNAWEEDHEHAHPG